MNNVTRLKLIRRACCLSALLVLTGSILSDPTHADAGSNYQTAMSSALAADQDQELGPALVGYVQALQAVPGADTPRANLLRMITDHGMPHALTVDQLTALRSTQGVITLTSPDPTVTLIGLDGSSGQSLDSLTDPQNQWPFPALIAAYTPSAEDPSKFVLVCSVHYQIADDHDFAEHTARLLVLLRSVLMSQTGHVPIYESPFNVWLSRSSATSPGGEQWRNNIYLYNLDDGRSSIEWVREIAHEYGHLAFPAIGGEYTSPEAWANGYIGERLMVRWLNDSPLAGQAKVEAAWGRTFAGYPNFKAKLIDPAVQTFTSIGLSKEALARNDEVGMRYVIGMLLWIDSNRGGHAVGDLLWNTPSPDPSDLYDAAKALGVPGPPRAMHTRRID